MNIVKKICVGILLILSIYLLLLEVDIFQYYSCFLISRHFHIDKLEHLETYDALIIFHVFAQIFYLPLLYSICKSLKNTKAADYMKIWRTDINTQFAVFVFALLFFPFIFITLSVNVFNILAMVFCLIGTMVICETNIIFAFCFIIAALAFIAVQSVVGVSILYGFWKIFDIIKYKKFIRFGQNTQIISHDDIIVKDNDDLNGIKHVKTYIMYLLSILTNNLYLLYKGYTWRKKLNILVDKHIQISRKCFINYILMIVMSYLIITLSITADNILMYVHIDSHFSLFISYNLILLAGLIYMAGTYMYVNTALTLIEQYTENKYGKIIKFNRIYAFLFGMLYLNYGINSYCERLSNSLKIEKFMKFIRFDRILCAASFCGFGLLLIKFFELFERYNDCFRLFS